MTDSPPHPSLNILVVDDEVNIRKTSSVCLETGGHIECLTTKYPPTASDIFSIKTIAGFEMSPRLTNDPSPIFFSCTECGVDPWHEACGAGGLCKQVTSVSKGLVGDATGAPSFKNLA